MDGAHARSSEFGDAPIVAALVAGDLSALGEAYDRYAQHLYTYACGMLRDTDAAADVVHDALLIASQRITQLRNPDRFRPWLYAIVRSECLRHLRLSKRSVPLDDSFDLEAPHETESAAEERDIRALVAAAAAGLSPKDREVLELTIRHDLDNAQVAAVLGIGMNQASTLTSRARTQLERSLSVLLVAQERGNACDGLDELLASWDGEFTPLWRKRIGRHMDKCATCSGIKDRKFRAAVLLGLFPLAITPFWLRDRIMGAAQADVELVALATRIDPLDREGFPTQARRSKRGVWFAGAGAALLAVGAGVGLLAIEPATSTPPIPAQFDVVDVPPSTSLLPAQPAPISSAVEPPSASLAPVAPPLPITSARPVPVQPVPVVTTPAQQITTTVTATQPTSTIQVTTTTPTTTTTTTADDTTTTTTTRTTTRGPEPPR